MHDPLGIYVPFPMRKRLLCLFKDMAVQSNLDRFLYGKHIRLWEVNYLPSQKVLDQKKEVVNALVSQLKNAPSGVLVEYKGITVAEDTKLRANLRKAGVDYSVVKNTLLSLAAAQTGYEKLDTVLSGTTALALTSTDPIAAAKILCEYAEKHENFKIKAGFIDGQVISSADVVALSKLPPKEVLVAQVLGTLNAPITGLVTVLNGTIRGLALALNAIAEKKSA